VQRGLIPTDLVLTETGAPNNAMHLTAKACGLVTPQVMAGVNLGLLQRIGKNEASKKVVI